MRWILLLSVFLILRGNFLSQTLNFENFTTKDGLLSDELFNMHQDRSGYLWVFTKYGALKFNGKNFVPVLTNLPVQESFIYCIYENAKGQKWVANSNANIYEIKNDSAFLLPGLESISKTLKSRANEITQLYQDDSLNFYLTGNGPCYKLKKSGKSYEPMICTASFGEDSVLYSLNDFRNTVLVFNNRPAIDAKKYIDKRQTLTYTRVNRTGDSSSIIENRFYRIPLITSFGGIRNCKKVGDQYYFVYSNGLWKIDRENKLSYTRLKSNLTNFTVDHYGCFWIGSVNNGLYQVNPSGRIINHFLDGLTVSDVLFDHQGGLWISTQGSGLFYCSNLQETSFVNHFSFGQIISCLKILDGALYVSNVKGELVKIEKNRSVKIKLANGLAVRDLVEFQGKIVFADNGGNVKELIKARTIVKDDKRNHNYSNLLTVNDTLLCLTRSSINYVVANRLRCIRYCKKKILAAEVFDGKLWLGTDDGFYFGSEGYETGGKYHNGFLLADTFSDLKNVDAIHALNGVSVPAVFKKGNHLWFSTQGKGLYCYQGDDSLKFYNKDNGLPENIINHFFCTDSIYLLSTNSGLYLSRSWSFEKGFDTWKKICYQAVSKALLFKNTIYAVSSKGLITLNFSNLGVRTDKYFVNLKSVRVDFKDVLPMSFHDVKSTDKSLEFDFDLINFNGIQPDLRYVLSGEQTDSVQTQNTNFRLTQLSPGEYTLRVYPAHEGGESVAVLIPFYVQPAFWQTLSFKILLVVFIVLLVALTIWLIIRRNRKRQEIRLKNEQLLLEYKLIALKAQVNPHFMSNCLSAIQDMVMGNNRDKATYYIAEFGLLMRQILEYSSRQTIRLSEELELLGLYVELEQLRFDHKFKYILRVAEGLNPKEIQVPPLIMNPIVENAIWHGLMPVKEERDAVLRVTVEQEAEKIVLIIEDNGKGFTLSAKEAIGNLEGGSYGMQITEQRISNWNYLMSGELASIFYENLAQSGDGATGTRVKIYLPNVHP